jgi:hypothetical protein
MSSVYPICFFDLGCNLYMCYAVRSCMNQTCVFILQYLGAVVGAKP